MKLFEDLINRITETQKLVLVVAYAADSISLAYAQLTGAKNIIEARNYLQRIGYLRINDNDETLEVTDDGEQVLKNNNLIDDSGELTENGTKMLESLDNVKKTFNESLKLFKHL